VKNFLSSIKRRHLLVILFQFMYCFPSPINDKIPDEDEVWTVA
jgi:hypothetical protein